MPEHEEHSTFISFDKTANSKQRTTMDLYRKQLESLGINPLQNINARIGIAGAIIELRLSVGASVSGLALEFTGIDNKRQ
tara:strand:+ start:23 stop:262 length:240 start_codon:yes stop_codon:yes gene_type:complete